MITKKRRITKGLASALLALSLLVVSPISTVFAKNTGVWTPDGFTEGEDGVFTSKNSGESTITYEKGSLDGVNTVEGSFLYKNDPTDAGGAYMGFQFWFNDTQFFIVRMYLNLGEYYDSNKPFFRAQKLTNSGYVLLGESPRLDRSAGFAKDNRIDFSVTLEDDTFSSARTAKK